MVVKRRLLLPVISALSLTLTAALPAAAAYQEAQPRPLRQAPRLQVRDIAANGATGATGAGPVVAVGYQEGGNPARLYVAFSTNGGRDYRRDNGRLRRFPILGEARLGISLAVCGGRVWAATAFSNPGDTPGDRDVLLTSRTIAGGAAQAFLTSPSGSRMVRDVQVACVGNKLLAVAWVEKRGAKFAAKLLLRTMEPLGQTPAFQRLIGLGDARFKDGIAVAASARWVHVAWTRGTGNLRMRRVKIENTSPPSVTPQPARVMASGNVTKPQLAAKGRRVLLAYTQAGKVRARLSKDDGLSFAKPKVVVNRGSIATPSVAHAVDVVGDRLVVEATRNQQGTRTPQRIESTNGGSSWSARTFGHAGTRVGVFLKRANTPARLMEAWHNNAATDTLRAQYERR